VTADAQAWRSADGRTWRHAALPGSAGIRIVQVVASAKAFLVVGLNGGDSAQIPNKGVTIWSSADGVAWKSKVLTAADWGWEKLFVLNDRFLAYEGADAMPSIDNLPKLAWQSTDGYVWTATGTPPASFYVIGSNGSRLVAQQQMKVAGAPLVLDQSIDGVHWSGLPIEVAAAYMEQARAVVPGGVFIAVSPVGALTYFEAVP
jgi:hypothetical protein